jgi:hypothetical protein
LDIKLDECARQPFAFPRSRGFACAKPHDRIVHANGLAGLHPDVAGDAVALVEESKDRHTIRHRRDTDLLTGLDIGARQRHAVCRILTLILPAIATGRQQEHERAGSGGETIHAQSGVQG